MATMDPQDEAFFAQLAGTKDKADETYEVELARANAGGMLTTASTAKPRILRTKAAAEEEAEPEAPEAAEAEEGTAWSESEPEGKLTVDVYQTPADMIVETAIAGVRPDDIDVHATTDSVTIRGSRSRQKPVKDEDYLYQECYWGRFARTIILPQEVDPDAADVTFKNGILTVRLPKANRKKTKKLKIVVE